ncbi:tyrosine-type recombinase/integrase [Streptacidiphilus melanogenes]|uniref:tyrosine-type recombinase/integrase n=1 Tax=Streptacidiphilus melanogenes TaxID=411235 RepID=UPI001364D172|nr:tyrosine-type recombinase/integrase [Streptacidiphilus melanogenes]
MASELVPVEQAQIVVPELLGERDHQLSGETIADLQRATAANTERAYDRWWRLAVDWCETEQRTVLPMTAQTLAEFIGHLMRTPSPRTGRPYSPSSLNQAIAAIRTAHYRAGHEGQPHTRAALELVKVHRQDRADDGWRTRRAKPVTLDVLRLMLASCDRDSVSGRRDAATLVLGYGLMGRRSELAAVRVEHLTFGDDWLTVWVPRSKTDQSAQGEEVEIPRELAPDIDAVAIVRGYLEALAGHGVTSGPLLRRIDRWGNLGDGLSGAAVNDIVKQLAQAARLSDAERTTAHGLRAGGPTDAAERGVPIPFIAEHGRWSKSSTQVLTYVRQHDRRRNNPLLRKE